MSGFTGHQAPGASEGRGASGAVFTWETAQAMLPLVGQIVSDLVRHSARDEELRPERELLERQRRTLDWPARARRYRLEEEATEVARDLRAVREELEALEVQILHPASGLIGFPTIVNERPAYFSWRPGEEKLAWWNFIGDPARRPIPEDWTQLPRRTTKGRTRSRK
jgi:hypothetical protein